MSIDDRFPFGEAELSSISEAMDYYVSHEEEISEEMDSRRSSGKEPVR